METKFKQIPRFHIRERGNLWPDYTLTLEDVSKLSVDDVKELFRAFSDGHYWFDEVLQSLRPDPFAACNFAASAKVYEAYRLLARQAQLTVRQLHEYRSSSVVIEGKDFVKKMEEDRNGK